jgi:hypothetical protein
MDSRVDSGSDAEGGYEGLVEKKKKNRERTYIYALSDAWVLAGNQVKDLADSMS